MQRVLLLPILLALAACEVGRVQMPMSPMTLGPSDVHKTSCARSGDASDGACRLDTASPSADERR